MLKASISGCGVHPIPCCPIDVPSGQFCKALTAFSDSVHIAASCIVWLFVPEKYFLLFLQSKAMNLYEACLTLLQVYSKNNLGRKRIDVTAEEDQYQDLLLIMELLTNLLSKEFIDFSDTGMLCRLLLPYPQHTQLYENISCIL